MAWVGSEWQPNICQMMTKATATTFISFTPSFLSFSFSLPSIFHPWGKQKGAEQKEREKLIGNCQIQIQSGMTARTIPRATNQNGGRGGQAGERQIAPLCY